VPCVSEHCIQIEHKYVQIYCEIYTPNMNNILACYVKFGSILAFLVIYDILWILIWYTGLSLLWFNLVILLKNIASDTQVPCKTNSQTQCICVQNKLDNIDFILN
jgi:hypothetical protein